MSNEGQGARDARAATPDITVVHLVRHGEVHNPDGVLYGRREGYHLSELGRQMADRVAEHLKSRDIAYVVSSPLERAQETAEPIAKAHGLGLATDARLLEAENVFEGKTFGVGDGALRKPGNWKHLTNPFKPSWGEPYVEQVVRMMSAVEAARDAARGHEAVAVSHQLPIWIVRSFAEKRVHARLADVLHVPGRQAGVGGLQRAGAGPGPGASPGRSEAGEGCVQGVRCLTPRRLFIALDRHSVTNRYGFT